MSHAYPTIVADTQAEVEQWHTDQMKRVNAMPSAHVDADTGTSRCRLMPIFPTKAASLQLWWPIPIEIVEAKAAIACLQEIGLQYDRSRKSKVGYERGLMVGLS